MKLRARVRVRVAEEGGAHAPAVRACARARVARYNVGGRTVVDGGKNIPVLSRDRLAARGGMTLSSSSSLRTIFSVSRYYVLVHVGYRRCETRLCKYVAIMFRPFTPPCSDLAS